MTLDPGLFLLNYPFVLTLAAGALAGASAILLRRASAVYGQWLSSLAILLQVGATLAFGWSFYWAWTIVEPSENAGFPVLAALGWFLALGGGALTLQALSVRGVGALSSWPAARVENRAPYRHIRRPIAVGLFLVLLGATLIVDTVPAYACLIAFVLLAHGLLELGDWELKLRLPGARDYIKRTPRYLPRLGRGKPGQG
jgi:protein-S-isoprenylcysteine O-methyltransferase Ste14